MALALKTFKNHVASDHGKQVGIIILLISFFLFPIYHFQLQLFLILLRRPDSKDLLQQLPFLFQHFLF
jgi:hypothetical protein